MDKSDTSSEGEGKYASFSRAELISEIKHLKSRKKFGLVWENKKENVAENFKHKIPFLTEDQSRRIELAPEEPTNLIIEGDNYNALAALSYTHAGKIDVIYIDPPYNTGNKDFVYNDNYVDKEDAFRHSKWLCFMERRLKIAKDLLTNTGILFISIDDNEQSQIKILCDQYFGENNFIGCAPRKTRGSATTKGEAELQSLNDYLLIYAKNKSALSLQKKIVGVKKYPYSDERGEYYIVPLQDNGPHGTREARPNLWYPIYLLKNGELTYEEPQEYIEKILPQQHQNKEGCWMWSKKKFDSDKKDLLAKDGKMYIKHYHKEGEDQNVYQYEKLWLDTYQNASGTKTLNNILGEKGKFNNPKPVELITYCIGLSKNKSATILDFFAGSGTTGQAVLELNKEDGGHRQFILCTNNENHIAENITYPRVKTVITGTRPDGSKYSDGFPANLRYYKINDELVDRKKSQDATRLAIKPYLEEIIQIRENAFKHLASNEDYSLYTADDHLVAVVFDSYSIDSILQDIKAHNPDNKLLRCYVFSYSRYDYSSDFDPGYEVQYIAYPEGLLEAYQRIINEEEREQ